MLVTNRRLKEILAGLNILKDKRLPTAQVEVKVATCLLLLTPAFDAYQSRRKKIIRELQRVNSNIEESIELERKLELHVQISDLDDELIEIPVPKNRFKLADLPQENKKDDKDSSTVGRAAIMALLGNEFFTLPEEDE